MRALSIGSMIALLGSTLLYAEDFSLTQNGFGPITVHTTLTYEGKGERLVATATNDSGQPVPYVRLCVNVGGKACLFQIWNTAQWEAGSQLSWNVTTEKHVPNLAHLVKIDVLNPPKQPEPANKLQPIRKVFVDKIDGNNGPMTKEQLMALLSNTGRFDVVEDAKLADAIIKGRSESRESGGAITASETGSANNSVVGLLHGNQSKAVEQTIISEAIVLRLLLPSGETIWAWDDSKPCPANQRGSKAAIVQTVGTRAKCAIDDLAAAAQK